MLINLPTIDADEFDAGAASCIVKMLTSRSGGSIIPRLPQNQAQTALQTHAIIEREHEPSRGA